MGTEKERRAIESTYDAECDIYEFVKRKANNITGTVKVKVNDIPLKCALSQKTLKPTSQTETVNTINYDAKLFAAPDIEVKPGSIIEVTQYGRTYLFESAGEAFVYPTHQEILLLRKDKA